jgi:hypothetical protein
MKSFIVQITDNSGPNPPCELRLLYEQSRSPLTNHAVWFKSHLAKFDPNGNSICIIFWRLPDSLEIEAIVARILNREGSSVPDHYVNFYSPHQKLKTFWKIGGKRKDKSFPDLVFKKFSSLDMIPGTSVTGKTASKTFAGKATKAIWTFPNDPLHWLEDLHKVQS